MANNISTLAVAISIFQDLAHSNKLVDTLVTSTDETLHAITETTFLDISSKETNKWTVKSAATHSGDYAFSFYLILCVLINLIYSTNNRIIG